MILFVLVVMIPHTHCNFLLYDDYSSSSSSSTTTQCICSLMAPEAEIYDYRVFGARGIGVNDAINQAIDDAIDEGCDVINMSLGGPVPDWRMRSLMRKANRAGVIMVVAAGNEGDNNVLTNENS